VAVHGRDQAAVSDVATAIRHEGGKAIAVTCGVTSYDHLEAMRHQIEEILGPVDILVANAGGSFTPPAPLEEIPEEGWRATIDGNLLATFLTLKSFLPGMKKRGHGSILTMASSAGRQPDGRAPIPLRCRQGRHRPADPRRRRPGGPSWDKGELHRPGDDPDRAQPRANPTGATGSHG
jgi:3-oxoacyl-[acyl-carrier protein] reductase